MANDFNTPLDIQEFPRATLYTPAPGVDNERSSFSASTLNGNPRFTVWTRVDDKEKGGPIQVGIGHEYIEGILNSFKRLFLSDVVDTIAYDNLKSMPGEEGRAPERVIGSTLMAGRDEDGLCFISLTSSDDSRPKIIFPFKGFEWHQPRRKSSQITDRERSTIHAVSMMDYLRKCFNLSVKGQTPEERKAIAEARKSRREGKGSYNGKGGSFQTKPTQQPRQAVDIGGDMGDFSF